MAISHDTEAGARLPAPAPMNPTTAAKPRLWLLLALCVVLAACQRSAEPPVIDLPPSVGSYTMPDGTVTCTCQETGGACATWPGRPPKQPGGSVAVLRYSDGSLLGYSCKHGALAFKGLVPVTTVPAGTVHL